MEPITCEEMADLLTQAVNLRFGVPIADHDGGRDSFTVAAPATGQLFTVTVAEKVPAAQAGQETRP
jgi:hypothetical protein